MMMMMMRGWQLISLKESDCSDNDEEESDDDDEYDYKVDDESVRHDEVYREVDEEEFNLMSATVLSWTWLYTRLWLGLGLGVLSGGWKD